MMRAGRSSRQRSSVAGHAQGHDHSTFELDGGQSEGCGLRPRTNEAYKTIDAHYPVGLAHA